MDVKTQIICLVVTNFLLSGFLFVASRVHRLYRGYRYWAFGNLGLACAWLLVAARGHIPDLFSIILASTMLAGVTVLHLVGLRIFLGLRPGYNLFWSVALVLVVIAGFTYVRDLAVVRISVVCGFTAAFMFLTGNLLRKNMDADNATIYVSMIGIYLVDTAALVWRGFSWLIWPRAEGIFQSSLSDNIFFLIQLGVDISWVIFFFAMNAQRLNLEVKKQNLELQDASRMKDRFLTVLAHDLRGPVGGLMSGLKIYREDYGRCPEDEKLRLLDIFAESAAAAYGQLEGLLAWGKDQAERGFDPRRICFFDIVENEILRIPENKGVIFANEVEPDAQIYADPGMIAAVIRNLLSNAVKFSGPGSTIRVSLSTSREKALVTVSDEGIGISEERLGRLFIPGETVDSKDTAGETGSGMGLVLCAGFIEKHGGSIRAESDGKKGSRVMFTLPAEPPVPLV